MKFAVRIVKIAPIMAVALLLQGCLGGWLVGGTAVAAGGAATYGYVKGTYRATLNAPIFEVDRAIRAVSAQAKLIEKKRDCTGRKAVYIYEDLADAKVHLKVRSITPETSKIYIRMGTLGDRDSSELFLRAVERELGLSSGS